MGHRKPSIGDRLLCLRNMFEKQQHFGPQAIVCGVFVGCRGTLENISVAMFCLLCTQGKQVATLEKWQMAIIRAMSCLEEMVDDDELSGPYLPNAL